MSDVDPQTLRHFKIVIVTHRGHHSVNIDTDLRVIAAVMDWDWTDDEGTSFDIPPEGGGQSWFFTYGEDENLVGQGPYGLRTTPNHPDDQPTGIALIVYSKSALRPE